MATVKFSFKFWGAPSISGDAERDLLGAVKAETFEEALSIAALCLHGMGGRYHTLSIESDVKELKELH
jgi:hypothetical protein